MPLLPDDCDSFYDDEFDGYDEADRYVPPSQEVIDFWLDILDEEELVCERDHQEEEIETIKGVTIDGRPVVRDHFE